MVHSGEAVAPEDLNLLRLAEEELGRARFTPIKAVDVGGTMDYLAKILGLIRGCGFGVAVFSERTPAPTLANIFFEVGLCHVFGKPVVLVKTEEARPPSDFVRTEWVSLRSSNGKKALRDKGEAEFRGGLERALDYVGEAAAYYRDLGEYAMDPESVDYEVAFERFKQAVLIGGDREALEQIRKIHAALAGGSQTDPTRAMRQRLRKEVGQFLKLVPEDGQG